jgi:hypothetical protein
MSWEPFVKSGAKRFEAHFCLLGWLSQRVKVQREVNLEMVERGVNMPRCHGVIHWVDT